MAEITVKMYTNYIRGVEQEHFMNYSKVEGLSLTFNTFFV